MVSVVNVYIFMLFWLFEFLCVPIHGPALWESDMRGPNVIDKSEG